MRCLHRKNLCQQRIAKTKEALVQHDELEQKVASSIEKIVQRLSKTTQQRNMMRSRHSAADALRTINSIEGSTNGDVDDTFERWELVISEAESEIELEEPADMLDKSFCAKEDESALRAELAELMNNNEEHQDE